MHSVFISFLALNSLAQPTLNARLGFLEPQNSFDFQIDCRGWERCEEANASLQQVGMMIANQILFKIPVKVCFSYKNSDSPTFTSTVSTAPPISLQRVVDNQIGPLMAYPTSVVKPHFNRYWRYINQALHENLLHKSDTIQNIYDFASECDISWNINSNINQQWYFGKGEFQRDEHDFQRMAAKAITHGLAFSSNLEESIVDTIPVTLPVRLGSEESQSQYYARRTPLDNLIHGPVRPSPDRRLLATMRRVPWRPAQILPLSTLWDRLDTIGIHDTRFNATNRLLRNNEAIEVGEQFRPTMRSPLLEARFRNGAVLPVVFNQARGYDVNLGATNAAEFVMGSSFLTGLSLSQLMQRAGTTQLFGPLTLSVFEEVGYSTLRKPQVVQFSRGFT